MCMLVCTFNELLLFLMCNFSENLVGFVKLITDFFSSSLQVSDH